MSQLLSGKTALILGVSNRWSLAYAIAQAFTREGAKLILTYQGDRQKLTVQELAADLKAHQTLPCDVCKDDELAQLIDELKSQGTVLNTVVHSIAFGDLSKTVAQTTRDAFGVAMDVSAYSLVAVARAVAPFMPAKEQGGGSIITLSYLGSTRVVENYNVMGVAKAALEASVRYLASDLGPSNIRVNAISAGAVKTVSARGVRDFSKLLEAAVHVSPLRRNTDPAEVADAAVFLASDLGRGVTGNILFVDAGMQIMGFARSEQ
jgi:enoyl-[acyl-carrier protein] reductase I